MTNKHYLLLLLIFPFLSHAQSSWTDLTGKEKAFFYQLTRKIENTKPEIFHLFEFTDSIPYVNDTLPDYPYILKKIEQDSSRLILHQTELTRKNTGILSDIATHYASWELGLVLQFRSSKKAKFQYLKPKFEQFLHYVAEKSPPSASVKLADGTYSISPTVFPYFAANLTINEKVAAIKNATFSSEEKYAIIRAIHYAQEKYIKVRIKEILTLLTGGQNIAGQNFLLAAGDGNNWGELESVLRTKYNRPLPDPKALFRYALIAKKDPKTEEKKVGLQEAPVLKFQTQKGKKSQLHVDVWGYHPEHQTTIVIQKGGNSYILYGKNEHRYVSPDSSFDKGITYWALLHELEHVLIADLKEKIYGKRGFDYLIEVYEKKTEATKLQIKNTEIKLDKIRHTPAGAPKMKKKKKKKKSKGYSYQDTKDTPQGAMTKTAKKRNIEQARLVEYSGQLQAQQLMLKQLKIEKELAFTLLAEYEDKLDKMKKNIGYKVLEYSIDKNGNYTFSDGTTFNYGNQCLTFQNDYDAHYFEVILISFGKHVLDTKKEDVFVHFNMSHHRDKDKFTLYNEQHSITRTKAYSVSDSIQIMEFFNALNHTKLKTNVSLNAIGMATGESPYYTSDSTRKSISPTDSIRNQLTHSTLIKIEQEINIEILTGSNAVTPNLKPNNFEAFKAKHPSFSSIDYHTYVQNLTYFMAWKNEMLVLAEQWLAQDQGRKKVMKKIKKLKPNTHKLKGQKI